MTTPPATTNETTDEMTDQTTDQTTGPIADETMTGPTVRSFVAVPLPDALKDELARVIGVLAAALPAVDVRWLRKSENLHVTMKFLGQVAPARVDALAQALAVALAAERAAAAPSSESLGMSEMPAGLGAPLRAFPAEVRGLGAFPTAARAGVLWAGVEDGAGSLAAVARVVEQTAARLGFAPASLAGDATSASASSADGEGGAGAEDHTGGHQRGLRSFRAHVTLGRCKRGFDARPVMAPWRAHLFGRFNVSELHLYESVLAREGSTYVLRGRAPLAAAA